MKRIKQKNITPIQKGIFPNRKIWLFCLLLLLIPQMDYFSSISSCQGALNIEGHLEIEEGEYFNLMTAQENTAYISTFHEGGNYILFVDLTNKSNPERKGSYYGTQDDYIHAKEINKGILYILTYWYNETSSSSSIQLIDITNLTKPVLIGKYQGLNLTLTTNIALYQNYIYLNTANKVLILDQTNKSNLKLINEIPFDATFIDECEGMLYLMGKTLQAYALTNPREPNLIGELNVSKLYRMGMKANRGIVYTLHWWRGLMVVDFRNPSNPKIVDKYHFPQRDFDGGETIFELAISNDYLFASGADTFAFDVSNPYVIRRVSKSEAGGNSIVTIGEKIITVSSNYLVILSLHDRTKYMIELGVSGGIIFSSSIVVLSISLNKKRKTKIKKSL